MQAREGEELCLWCGFYMLTGGKDDLTAACTMQKILQGINGIEPITAKCNVENAIYLSSMWVYFRNEKYIP